jgi:hypothetical protein
MQIRDEYACVPIVLGGPRDGMFPAPGITWPDETDARNQRARLIARGHHPEELAIVHRTVTYANWEVVARPTER